MAKAYTGIERRKPYDRPQSGVLSKVKRIFSWSGKSEDASPSQSNVTVNLNTPFKQIKQSAPGGWPSVFSTPAGTVEGVESPKPYFDTLAEFFKNKQHEPLSAIEVEGIISLIQKSKSGAEGKEMEVFEDEKELEKDDPTKQEIKSVQDVPLQQYHPRTESLSHRPIFATRRKVVEFSSLPSPYRVRLSSPLDSFKEKRALEKPKLSETPFEVEKPKVAKPAARKKMGKAATALLSVLDSDTNVQEEHDLKSIEEKATKRVKKVMPEKVKEQPKDSEKIVKPKGMPKNETPKKAVDSNEVKDLFKKPVTSTPAANINGTIEGEFQFPPAASDIEYDPSQIDSSKVELFCKTFVFPSI